MFMETKCGLCGESWQCHQYQQPRKLLHHFKEKHIYELTAIKIAKRNYEKALKDNGWTVTWADNIIPIGKSD